MNEARGGCRASRQWRRLSRPRLTLAKLSGEGCTCVCVNRIHGSQKMKGSCVKGLGRGKARRHQAFVALVGRTHWADPFRGNRYH